MGLFCLTCSEVPWIRHRIVSQTKEQEMVSLKAIRFQKKKRTKKVKLLFLSQNVCLQRMIAICGHCQCKRSPTKGSQTKTCLAPRTLTLFFGLYRKIGDQIALFRLFPQIIPITLTEKNSKWRMLQEVGHSDQSK